MNRTPRTHTGAALACAGLLALTSATACSADQGVADDDPAALDARPPAATSDATRTASPTRKSDLVTALSDTFDDDANGWAVPPSPQGITTVGGGDFVWESKQPMQHPHLVAATLAEAFDAGRLDMTDVRVTATVTPRRGAATLGVFCREVPDTDADFQWYEFVVRDGYAAIRLADDAGNVEPLDEGRAAVPLGKEAGLQATCVDESDGSATLTLALNGEHLLRARVEQPLGNGASGLQAYDAPSEESTEMLLLDWHDFSVEPAG